MRKIEKETLEIINNFQSERYLHLKKLMTIRENQIKEEVENNLQSFIDIERIKNRIEEFKKLYDNDISVNFTLEIRSYYTDYQSLFDKDNEIQNLKVQMNIIEDTRNKMKLILQNSEIKSEEYKKLIVDYKRSKLGELNKTNEVVHENNEQWMKKLKLCSRKELVTNRKDAMGVINLVITGRQGTQEKSAEELEV